MCVCVCVRARARARVCVCNLFSARASEPSFTSGKNLEDQEDGLDVGYTI